MIKNIILLTKISTRNILENYKIIDKESKKINKSSKYVWIIAIILIAIAYSSNEIINILKEYGQLDIFPNILFTIVCIVMFIQTIILNMNVLFFSKDIEYLIPFPIKDINLLISRINTIILILYVLEGIFVVIPMVLYGIAQISNFSYYIRLLFVLIVLPIFPTVISSIINLILLKVIKKIKNKNKLQLLITLIFILLIIFVETICLKQAVDNRVENVVLNNGVIRISTTVNKILLIINPLLDILNKNNILINILKILFIYSILFCILIYFGKKYYMKDILKYSVYIKKKNIKKIKIDKKCKKRSPYISYIKNELKGLIKSAMIFMQTVYPSCIIIITMYILTILLKSNIMTNFQSIAEIFNTTNLNIDGITIVLIILQILFSIPGISITAISRQGKDAIFMKYIPINVYKQFLMKCMPEFILDAFICISIIIVAKILFIKITLLQMLLLIIIGVIMCILNNFLMLIVDIKKPILDWNSEIEVMKQNSNKIFQYFWTIIIFLILMYLKKIFINMNFNVNMYVCSLILLFLIFIIIINYFIIKQINKNKFLNKIK